MRSAEEIVTRAEREIAAGRAWRAKEILRGALATRAEPALLERYGRLLDSTGERYEAGKYLFLSGTRTPEYAEAIEVFLARNAARRDADFVGLFPAAVRRFPLEQLPAVVQEALKARGVLEHRFTGAGPIVPTVKYTVRDRLVMVFSVTIALIFLAALVIGLRQIAKSAWTLLF